jgi:hydroxymethylbilane synthase
MSPKIIRIATRQSPLALWQANHIRDQLLSQWPSLRIELLPLLTSGDRFLKNKLSSLGGGKGLFVKELEEALLDKRADLAVHSMKDVPALFPPGLCLGAICTRDNPQDAFLSNNYGQFTDLPEGSCIGTASLRRQSQLLAIRPDLQIKALRGNIQTRIAKLNAGDYDAIILAAAGLERMGMQDLITEALHTDLMLPACGQGALGIECREDDDTIFKLIKPLNDPLSALCVQIERHVNKRLGGNCHVPVAVFCEPQAHSQLLLRAKVASIDGKIMVSNRQQGHQEEGMTLAEQCAQGLLNSGAEALLGDGLS